MPKLLNFEGKQQPLLPQKHYISRLVWTILASIFIIVFFLMVGVVGYHITCGFSWIDSLLNASMILSGMGPVNLIENVGGKWFASLYALVSGVVFISSIGLMIAPVAHRLFHKFNLEESN